MSTIRVDIIPKAVCKDRFLQYALYIEMNHFKIRFWISAKFGIYY